MGHGYGYVPDAHDTSKDTRLRALLGARRGLPAAASLEQYISSVWDQGQTSSCTGWAFSRSVQLRLQAMGRPFFQPSPSALYTFGRALDRQGQGLDPSTPLQDSGAQPALVVRGMQQWGIPGIDTWPFDPFGINQEPDLLDLEVASQFELQGYYRIDETGSTRCDAIRQALSEGIPVCIGVTVDQAFEDYEGNYLFGAPDLANPLGGHMLCVVGYSGSTFRVVNQWGSSWGDHGFINASEDFLTNAGVGDVVAITVS